MAAVSLTAFFAAPSWCAAAVIQHGTEDFCQLSGFVYNDLNNDGTRGTKEWLIPDIEIILTGTSYLGDAVNLTASTGTTGYYVFTNLVPGTYALEEVQPEILHTAMANPVGTAGGSAPSPNKFVGIKLDSGKSATGYNFGEWGLKAKYMTKRDFIVVVPEPTTFSLLGFLFAGIVLYRFRGRRKDS